MLNSGGVFLPFKNETDYKYFKFINILSGVIVTLSNTVELYYLPRNSSKTPLLQKGVER